MTNNADTWGELDLILTSLPLIDQGNYDYTQPIIEPPHFSFPENPFGEVN